MAGDERVWCRVVFRETSDGFEIVIKGKDCDKLFKELED